MPLPPNRKCPRGFHCHHWLAAVVAAAAVLLLPAARCPAQHLWWDKGELGDSATCLYGETIVLATMPGFYYSSAVWWPGSVAGGYCGIQHNRPTERRTIFSIWDTSPTWHPAITEADRRTYFGRFGGEGEGGHTHMLWDWRERFSLQHATRPTRTIWSSGKQKTPP